ncbi:MAG: TonB-dependent receptor plug [Edaphobacter sp.]|nr:TonB-dependent receptor plug [Edaphobacter sp.]
MTKFRERLSIHREGPLITALETATNVAKTISFNSEGEFAIPFLTAGHYPVTVVKDGFKRYEQDNILLQVSDSISLKMALQIGEVTIGTTVNTVVQGIRTADANLGTVIDSASWKICLACRRLLNPTWLTTRSQLHLDHI